MSRRQWWPLSSKQPLPGKQSFQSDIPPSPIRKLPSSSAMKFSTFTSAMGFKSKKNSSPLVIQDRPPDIHPPPSIPTPRQRTRPSVSTVMSSDYPNEPQTPTDFSRDTASPLLQTPDLDSFSPSSFRRPSHFPDPNRLSIWSGSSASDMISRKPDLAVCFKRLSITSSSTDSQYLGVDLSANSSASSLSGVFEPQMSPTYVSCHSYFPTF